jgi:hypothetical protein
MGVGISADVTDMTAPSRPRSGSASLHVAGIEASRLRATISPGRARETCRHINFPSVEVIDLEAPQLPEKEYAVAAKRRSNEPMIMEMITSVSKALQEYERAGGFSSAAATDAEDVALTAPAARMESTEDASALPHVIGGREASPPRSV